MNLKANASPVNLTQAFTLADVVLDNACLSRLEAVARDAGPEQLRALGVLTAGRWELNGLAPAVGNLRHLCARTKPCPTPSKTVLDYLALRFPTLSAVAREALALLPELAAETATVRAEASLTNDVAPGTSRFSPRSMRRLTPAEVAQKAATARAQAADALALIAQLSDAVSRIKTLAEAGQPLHSAAAWLK